MAGFNLWLPYFSDKLHNKNKNSHYVTWKTSFLRAEHLYSH
ncbi:hypothetical protein XBJ2_870061 [Xenorhabdus bovienii str. Jollieti]|uniref:Uncharacterized protein n=1 Tax=Xenorhabdus bovienii (strain SS-2004) TaxID=406818 RepID=D3V0T8_XENBS|nr:hypothetical protein XBJ1_1644 [Xenorhabdus bovienii SS-2004]CDH30482.1 hypothetical protein XBJ2_870061 [Xenorhabdus bovienii str. Jollieti]